MQINPEFVYPAAASVCAAMGSITDVRSRRVPNWLTGPSILIGLALHFAFGGWHGMFVAAAAGLICGAIFLVFFIAGGMGAGDVKLITAIGCLVGMSNIVSVLALTAIAGGVMAVALAVSRGQLKQTLFNVGALASHHTTQGLKPHPELNVLNKNTLRLPYALAIAAGTIITFYLQGAR
ncbi:MAG TPA: A24 family peptidase [Acidobacteriaceae bacterium]|nr:A24 family peptidase [Acidobacteriaceae bacterium]